jgi:hypothetical protein
MKGLNGGAGRHFSMREKRFTLAAIDSISGLLNAPEGENIGKTFGARWYANS